jgi:hypothetical protein
MPNRVYGEKIIGSMFRFVDLIECFQERIVVGEYHGGAEGRPALEVGGVAVKNIQEKLLPEFPHRKYAGKTVLHQQHAGPGQIGAERDAVIQKINREILARDQ